MIAAMAARSPARFLAPLALVAVVVALYVIINPRSSDGGGSDSGAPAATQPTASPVKKPHHKKKKQAPSTYTVKPGDTPSGIAEKTGVPLSTLEELNPSLDPQALAPGTKLKLK
jgi:LysM repeat protein